jgi:hypothetical protein
LNDIHNLIIIIKRKKNFKEQETFNKLNLAYPVWDASPTKTRVYFCTFVEGFTSDQHKMITLKEAVRVTVVYEY